ncbi:hypothetical protein [uncultured Paracoccus sp.]|uniref:hypothetical protein n=1 Tax=uncultured Paracoccus sp. TaxID=189685 RepID=UPI0026088FD5|nr:hypothetical protein [uncultured Paracoccus sp.]
MRYFGRCLGFLVAPLARIAGYIPDRLKDRWVAGAASGLGVAGIGANVFLSALGFTAVTHSSGAAILTGAGGYVAGTIGVASVASFLMLPITILVFVICAIVGMFVLLKRKRA